MWLKKNNKKCYRMIIIWLMLYGSEIVPNIYIFCSRYNIFYIYASAQLILISLMIFK